MTVQAAGEKKPKKRRMVYERGGSRAGRGKKGRFSMFQTRSRRRFWEEPEESSLLLPSIPFQLCFPPPSSSFSLLWVYPSGFFSPISPPAVLGTLDCCLSPISHTHAHTHSLTLTHIFLFTFSSLSCSPYFKMFLILLPILKSTTCYLSVYPPITSIYSFNPSTWRSTSADPSHRFLLPHRLLWLPLLLPPVLFPFSPHPFVLSRCHAELWHISDTPFSYLPPHLISCSSALRLATSFSPLGPRAQCDLGLDSGLTVQLCSTTDPQLAKWRQSRFTFCHNCPPLLIFSTVVIFIVSSSDNHMHECWRHWPR